MPRRVEAGLARCAMSIFVLFRTNITPKEGKGLPVLNRARRSGSKWDCMLYLRESGQLYNPAALSRILLECDTG